MTVLSEQTGVIVDNRLVALAGRVLQPHARENADLTANVADELSFSQRACGDGDRTSTHAQHVGEELVREVEMIRVRAVMRHQQPACRPCFDLVESSADSCP